MAKLDYHKFVAVLKRGDCSISAFLPLMHGDMDGWNYCTFKPE